MSKAAQTSTAGQTPLPWKVYFQNHHAGVTRHRDGRETKTTSRYFETKADALVFAAGDERRVLYRPGEAWRPATACAATKTGGA